MICLINLPLRSDIFVKLEVCIPRTRIGCPCSYNVKSKSQRVSWSISSSLTTDKFSERERERAKRASQQNETWNPNQAERTTSNLVEFFLNKAGILRPADRMSSWRRWEAPALTLETPPKFADRRWHRNTTSKFLKSSPTPLLAATFYQNSDPFIHGMPRTFYSMPGLCSLMHLLCTRRRKRSNLVMCRRVRLPRTWR